MKARWLIVALGILVLGLIGASPVKPPQRVEIIKFVSHPALDATEAGLIAQLRGKFGVSLKITTHNAQGNPSLAKTLAESALASRPDVIVAIATPAAQAVARTPRTIPFVYAAVADPEGAGILASGNVTGIKNVGPHIVQRALEFIRHALPSAKKLGTLFNPAEQNSVYVQNIVKEKAPMLGFDYLPLTVNASSQAAAATESLAQRVDVIYSANDNTINSAASGVASVAVSTGKPFFIGDLATLDKGAFAAIGLDYSRMGRDVGLIVARILSGEAITSIPPQDAPPPDVWLNEPVRQRLGLVLSKEASRMISHTIGR